MITLKVNKVVPYSITSVGHGADPGFLAVSLQVTLVINPVVGCRYFPPGLRLLSQPKRSPLACTKVYCLVTEAYRCKWLAQGHYAIVPSQVLNPRPVNCKTVAMLIAPPHHAYNILNISLKRIWSVRETLLCLQAVDWWSLGVLTYELLTGTSPFTVEGSANNQSDVSRLVRF